MQHSGSIICIPEVPESTFLEAVSLAVGRNLHLVPEHKAYAANGSMYVRPLLFASGAQLALAPPSEFTFLVYVTPTGSLYGSAGGKAPAVDALVLHLFDRAAPLGTGSAKVRRWSSVFPFPVLFPRLPSSNRLVDSSYFDSSPVTTHPSSSIKVKQRKMDTRSLSTSTRKLVPTSTNSRLPTS